MMDRLTLEQRRQLMARIKSKDTEPEMLVRRLVHGMGYRYRLHVKSLPGTPDVVFHGRKKVIQVNGCFWHQHPGCKRAWKPKSRIPFWTQKFAATTKRDEMALKALRDAGWKVLVLWECELGNKTALAARIDGFLSTED